MSEKKEKSERKVKKVEKPKSEKKSKRDKEEKKAKSPQSQKFALLADSQAVDQTLSSLFATPAPVVPRQLPEQESLSDLEEDEDDADAEVGADVVSAVEDAGADAPGGVEVKDISTVDTDSPERKRKRKRRDEDDLEGAYMDKLAREEERDSKRKKRTSEVNAAAGDAKVEDAQMQNADSDAESDIDAAEGDAGEGSEDEEDAAPLDLPKHETVESAETELAKAGRTVFLGNVSTTAITSKSALKTLTKHLASFFDILPKPKSGDVQYKVESIRFRSTPYAAAIPKKAAFAKKELMDATTKSTNAYVVYSAPNLAREAAKRLNASMVLDRHLRVDEVAHPAQTDSRRCVFVGNLGFVDDESNIQDANEEEGREKRKRAKEPSDIEEGLWRIFGRCGTVESVRVIRDSTTRVGKGIAYVQFEDANAVEAALLYNEKKFPPMLPRKLRVSRAKAQKRNAKPGSGRPGVAKPSTGYKRKITGEEASQMGRAGKLYGRAAASNMRKPVGTGANLTMPLPDGIKRPEAFVFEGHRASSNSKPTLKMAGGKKKGKPTNRSAKRGAAYKAGQKKGK